jgi:hypothetical protein
MLMTPVNPRRTGAASIQSSTGGEPSSLFHRPVHEEALTRWQRGWSASRGWTDYQQVDDVTVIRIGEPERQVEYVTTEANAPAAAHLALTDCNPPGTAWLAIATHDPAYLSASS